MTSGTIPVDLGTKKISTLLKEYAVPAIIAMTASSVYNMVDSIFIGHIPFSGSLAISGLAVTFPLMNLSTALGTLVGVGAATMISVFLGQKNYKLANKVLANEVLLNTIIGALFAIGVLCSIDPILRFFGATEEILPYARDYMRIILYGNVITHLYFGLNSVIRSSGSPKLAMGLTIFTVMTNAVLDPIFIYVFGMGIKGAAWATVLCQFLGMLYSLYFFSNQKRFLHLPKTIFEKMHWKLARKSLSIGMGPFLMNSAACVVAIFVNQQIGKYGGSLAIGAYGIVNRFIFIFIMMVLGMNQGMQPIAGYNFGARQYSRVRNVYWLTAFWATIITSLGFIISVFFSKASVSIFTSDEELISLGVKGLRWIAAALPIVGIQMVSTNLFQCLGMVHKSIFLSLSRQLLFLLPLLYFLPFSLGMDGVWISFPVSDVISFVVTMYLIMRMLKKMKGLADGDSPDILGSKIR